MAIPNIMNPAIICPNCKHKFSPDEAFSHELEEKLKLSLRDEFNQKYLTEKKKLEEKIGEESGRELKLLQEQLSKQKQELDRAREFELDLRKKTRELEEKEKNLELEKQRQIDEERKKIQEKTELEMIEKYHLKEKEKDSIIESLKKSLEEAQRKANQGSQQLQGEVLELELEEFLKKEFPADEIKPVAKGIRGADVLQIVRDSMGREAGIIVWESKRTKNWAEGWTQKLKDDLRTSKADAAVLVSQVLPGDIKYFGPKDGIYITNFDCLLSVATMIRLYIIREHQTKKSVVGKNEKMEMMYNYLSGNEFRGRVEAIVEAFSQMKEDLEKEKRMYSQIWAKREKQIERVINSTLGMHGDLQGLMGASLPEIKSLEISTVETFTEADSTKIYTQSTLMAGEEKDSE